MSILKVNTIQKKDGTAFPLGKIGQVGSAINSSNYTGTNTSFTELSSSMRVTLTPASSSSYFICTFISKCRYTVSQQYTSYKLVYSTDSGSTWNDIANTEQFTGFNNTQIQDHHVPVCCQGYFTPNTTNQTIFSIYVKTNNNSWSLGTVAATGQNSFIVQEVLA